MTPSPALPREGQPGIPGQVQDHLVSPVPCEARTALLPCPFCGGKGAFVSSASLCAHYAVVALCGNCGAEVAPGPNEESVMQRWNRRCAAQPAPAEGMVQIGEDAARLHAVMDAADKYWEASTAARFRLRSELVSVVLSALRAAPPRRDAADTEPHGPNELNSESAPGESADPQSQGDTQ